MSLAQTVLLGNRLVITWLLLLFLVTYSRFSNSVAISDNKTLVYKKNYSFLLCALIAIPIIIWSGTRGDVEDTSVYRWSYINLDESFSGLLGILHSNSKGKGFKLITWILKQICRSSDTLYFCMLTMIMMICVIHTYRMYSCILPLSVLLFVVSGDCYQWTCNGIRQGLAVCIVFSAAPLLLNKRYITYGIAILIAYTIHVTAILAILPIFFINQRAWSRRTIIFIASVIFAGIVFDRFLSVLFIALEDSYLSNTLERYANQRGVKFVRVLVYSIPAIIAFVFRERFKEEKNTLIDYAINMSVLTAGFYFTSMFSSGMLFGRLPIYFSLWNYILLPWEIRKIFPKGSRFLIYTVMIIFYLVFNHYQMDVFMKYYWNTYA